MGLWMMIFLISAVAISTEFVVRVVKIGTRHYENIERIRHGYPTLEGSVSIRGGDAYDTTHNEHGHMHAHTHGERLQ